MSLSQRETCQEPARLEGWLRVCSEDPEVGRWEKRYCTLSEDERRLRFFSDTESVLVSSSLETIVVGDPNGLFKSDISFDATGCFQPALKNSAASFSRSGRKFGSRVRMSIKRSKSLNRKSGEVRSTRQAPVRDESSKEAEKELRGNSVAIMSPRSVHRSLDSLESCASYGDPSTSINLAMQPSPHVAELHASVSPTENCFFLSFKEHILYFSAPSAQAMQVWIERISRQIKPQMHVHRIHLHNFSLGLTEVKGMKESGKGKCCYYCDVEVDGSLFARTASKEFQDVAFWGDHIVISNFPSQRCVSIKLFKDTGAPSPRQRSKTGQVNQAVYMGKVDLHALEHVEGVEKENWFPVDQSPGVTIRIRSCYEEITVLPIDSYIEMTDCILKQPRVICTAIEPFLDGRSKEQFANTLLSVLSGADLDVSFLVALAMEEVNSLESETLIFRGNTIVSKLMDCHMRATASEYLKLMLKETINFIYESEGDCEVDPSKLPPNFPASQLNTNQAQLMILVEKVWCRIFSSYIEFPAKLRRTLFELREQLRGKDVNIARRVVTGSVFLRFICPAILSPSAFQLSAVYPDDKVSRRLKLVGKVIQCMASFAKFGARENYLTFMNEFISKERSKMETFIDQVSSQDTLSRREVPEASIHHSRQTSQEHLPLSTVQSEGQQSSRGGMRRMRTQHSKNLSDPAQPSPGSSYVVSPLLQQEEADLALPRLLPPPGMSTLPLASAKVRRDLAVMHNILQKHSPKLSSSVKEQMSALLALVRLLSDDIHRPQPLTSQLSMSQMMKASSMDNLADLRPMPVSGNSDRRISQERLPHRRLSTNEEPDVRALLDKSLHFDSANAQRPAKRLSQTQQSQQQQQQQQSAAKNDGSPVTRGQHSRPSRLGPESSLKELYESVCCWHRRNLNIGQRPLVELPRSELDAEILFLRQQLADATILLSHSTACLGMYPESWESEDGSLPTLSSATGQSSPGVRAHKLQLDQWKSNATVGAPSAAEVRERFGTSALADRPRDGAVLKHLISSSGVHRLSPPPYVTGPTPTARTLLEVAREARSRSLSGDLQLTPDPDAERSAADRKSTSAPYSVSSTSAKRASTSAPGVGQGAGRLDDCEIQLKALHQANAHFSASLNKHFKDFNDFQAVDDLLSLNASLAASTV